MIVRIAAALGALITVAACIRMIVALRRGESRDVVVGWFALMIAAPAIVFALDRVA